jgi:hypothetical protein
MTFFKYLIKNKYSVLTEQTVKLQQNTIIQTNVKFYG